MIEFKINRYVYPNGKVGLEGVSGRIEKSCFISGYTGSGKSTLLRTFNGLIPYFYSGTFDGKVMVFGENPDVKKAYFIAQNPYEQITSLKVMEEIIFPAVQSGMRLFEVKKESEALAEEFGVVHLLDRTTHTLSAGELQIVEIISAIVSGKRLILMDEPFAHLSKRNVENLLRIIEDYFVVVSDHRIEFREFFEEAIDFGIRKEEHEIPETELGEVVYDGIISLRKREIVAVTGDNGAGKTTLLKRIAEDMKKKKLDFGIALHNPNYHFTESNVMSEVGDERLIADFGLCEVRESNPHSLSYGQAKRVSIAKAFKHEIILLDEPTAGQDVSFREKLLYLIRKYGKSCVLTTHDENLARMCDRVIEL